MKCCHEKIHWTKRRTLLVYRSAASTLCFDTNSFSTDWSLHQSELSGRGSFRPAARGGEMCQDTVTFVKRCKFSIKHTILSEWFLIVKALVRRFQQGKGPNRGLLQALWKFAKFRWQLYRTPSHVCEAVSSLWRVSRHPVSQYSLYSRAHGAAAADPVTSYVANQQRSRGCKKTAQKQERLCDNGCNF